MYFFPADPRAYEAARDAIMRRRGAAVRTLYALEAILACLDVEASIASDEDFRRALMAARAKASLAPGDLASLIIPAMLDSDRELTLDVLAPTEN